MEREIYVKKRKRDPYLMALALTQIEDNRNTTNKRLKQGKNK